MKNVILGILLFIGIGFAGAEPVQTEIWTVSNFLEKKSNVKIEGSPKSVHSPLGRVVAFDGEDDRFIVKASPLAGAAEFTVEMLFKPNDAFPQNHAPRIVHIESPDNNKRRIVLEARINEKGEWYFDAFIMSETKRLPLLDKSLTHPTGKWHHVAVVYQVGEFSTFVNGKRELSGKFQYVALPKNTRVSIGSRMNRVNWFNGEISSVAFTHSALSVVDMPLLNRLKSVNR